VTGIAEKESSYQQFHNRSLYGVTDLWPTESYDGGSHIGLMQLPVSMLLAWNWLENTLSGVDLFRQKLAAAIRNEQRIIATHPGLRHLTRVEVENMALVLYGPYAPNDPDLATRLTKQYYAPQCSGTVTSTPQGLKCSSGWDWVVNNAGNPSGVAYANDVRLKMH
jgi:hypothetical protein